MDLVIRRGVAAVTAAAVLSACAPVSVSVPGSPRPTTDHESSTVTATVTSEQLGRGSVLAVVRRARSAAIDAVPLATSLEVITPDGERHPVWSTELTSSDGTYPGEIWLADWRPELHTALLRVRRGRTVADEVVAYDLVSGTTRSLVLPRRATSAGLAPDGTGILVALSGTGPAQRLVAVRWSGSRTRLPGTTGGHPLVSRDGRLLVTPAGDRPGWWVIDLRAGGARRLTPPGSCDPVRWLDDRTLLADCYANDGNQLRAVRLDGSSRAVGAFHPVPGTGRPRVLSDGDVRTVARRPWFLTWRGCGTGVLTDRAGHVVPGTVGLAALMRGRRRDELLLARGSDPCRPRRGHGVLELLDPVSGDWRVVTRLGEDEHWRTVIDATEVRAWNP